MSLQVVLCCLQQARSTHVQLQPGSQVPACTANSASWTRHSARGCHMPTRQALPTPSSSSEP